MAKPRLTKPIVEAKLKDLLAVKKDGCATSVFLASVSKMSEVPRYEKLQLSDDLAAEFTRAAFGQVDIWRIAQEGGDLVLHEYQAGSKPDDHEVEYLDIGNHDTVALQIAILKSPADLGLFKKDDGFLKDLRFYVILVQPLQGPPIWMFRMYSPKKELSQSPYFGALLTDGHFDRVRQPFFLFDSYVDCVAYEDAMFIRTKDGFQKIFRFFEYVLQSAKATLETIKQNVPIANFGDFEAACKGHLQMLAKLKNIAEREYFKRIRIADIKNVIKHFELNVKITRIGKKEMLVFNPQDKWELLRLLDDDYLRSLMTGNNYEATGKRLRGQ